MKVKDLIIALQSVDDDLLDYEVGVISRIQLTKDCRISFKSIVNNVFEHADIGQKIIYIRAKEEI